MKTNQELIKFLNSKKNISKLEKLLKQKIKPKFETQIDVFKETNDYLRTNEGIPKINYNQEMSKYNSFTKTIYLRKDANILDIAHEYTHYIENVITQSGPDYSYSKEGLARGVETHIAQLVGGEVLVENYVLNYFEYLQVYLTLCKELNKKPKKKFAKHLDIDKINPHAWGNTILSLYKLDYGDDVYWKMLYNKF